MPWKEVSQMKERENMINDWLLGEHTIQELSEIYSVSRKTVYKWISRFQEFGMQGLKDRSRAAHKYPNQTTLEMINLLAETKLRFFKWGPKKIIYWLRQQYPENDFPSPSTAGYWLKRIGLTHHRKRRHRIEPYSQPFIGYESPNDVWSIDYKGQFLMKDQKYCYPLTISDNVSRYLLLCKGLLATNYQSAKKWTDWTFHEYGLPLAIRSDNGTPFSSISLAGLSRLSIHWIKLGIRPERIDKGHPEQNGRHERMHKTLKEYISGEKASNIVRQQIILNDFRDEYNNERPHEALSQHTPFSCYQPSDRKYPTRIKRPDYTDCDEVRKVKHHGEISYKGKRWFLTELLKGELVGLKEIDDDKLQVLFYKVPIANLNLRHGKVEQLINKKGRRNDEKKYRKS
ncbi:MAG: transposase [Clostridiales bacterium]|nr:transposase [Clostridiales bacterium]